MKVLSFDKKDGIMRLLVENDDDLWHLSNILEPGAKVKMRDQRKVKMEFGERTEATKVNVTLTIAVEKTEFHEFLNTLRIGGKILESSKEEIPLGSYHTFAVEPGDTMTIVKEFSSLDFKRIDESKLHQPKLLLVLVDRDSALFAQVRAFGVTYPTEIDSKVPSKRDADAYEAAFKKFFAEVASAMANFKTDATIIAGPGNVKDNLSDYLRKNHPQLKFRVENTSTATRSSVKELVGRTADKLLAQTSLARDTVLVDELFMKVAKGNLATYGPDAVAKAVEYGAVEKLLVSAELVKKWKREGTYGELEKLLKAAEAAGATIHLVGSGTEAGDKLDGLSGLAAILRFRIE